MLLLAFTKLKLITCLLLGNITPRHAYTLTHLFLSFWMAADVESVSSHLCKHLAR